MVATKRRLDVPPLTLEEIKIILDAMSHKYGAGYSEEPGVGQLQAKLSILMEVRRRMEVAGQD